MATGNGEIDPERTWFEWARSTLGVDEARCRAAARAATAVQGVGAGFTTAAAAARAAYSEGGLAAAPQPAVAEPVQPQPVEESVSAVSPDGRWGWNSHTWVEVTPAHRAVAPAPVIPPPAPSHGLSSWVGGATSEDLFYGQAVIVWARWILIATGIVLSFWAPSSLSTLQIQLAAIIALAFGNFYLHVQLLRGHPAIDRVVYAASAADLAVVTTLVIAQGGYGSVVFVFYFAAVLGLSVAFPAVLTALYTAAVLVGYGVICLSTTDLADYPAVFTRLLMIAAIAVCGAIFARSESHRRAEAIRVDEGLSDESTVPAAAADRAPAGAS